MVQPQRTGPGYITIGVLSMAMGALFNPLKQEPAYTVETADRNCDSLEDLIIREPTNETRVLYAINTPTGIEYQLEAENYCK